MSKIEEIKAEFEGVEIEWRLHERIRQMFAYIEAAEAWRSTFGSNAPLESDWPNITLRYDQARRALGLE